MVLSFLGREKSVNGGSTTREERGTNADDLKPFDLNTADEESLAKLQNIGPERARALVEHRPYKSWRDVERIPGFGGEIVDILALAGAQIGAPAAPAKSTNPGRG